MFETPLLAGASGRTLQTLAITLLCALLGAMPWLEPARADTPAISLTSLLPGLVDDVACSELRFVGLCHCGPVPCGVRVQRYVAVAVVETTRAPGDSVLSAGLVGLPALAGEATVSSALSATDNTSEAHVWTLPAVAPSALACATCTAASALAPLAVLDASAGSCGPAAAVAQALSAVPPSFIGPWAPRLAYASEIDALNWRTGCRDLANPATSATLALPGCLLGAGPLCLGQWGLLVPRQMRDLGPSPLLYAAKTAVRALSIARDQLGTLPYPVDTDGKLQQIYPTRSACIRIGQALAAWPAAAAPQLSPDGRHAWLYWRPSQCCVAATVARQCAGLHN